MTSPPTLIELLRLGAPRTDALLAPGRPALTFAALWDLVEGTVFQLNALGIGRGDAVAIVLPNGPAMATAFLGVAPGAVAAPLNPAYKADEFDFFLGDLNAKALVVELGSTSPAIAVAAARGIPRIDLVEDMAGPAGRFELRGTSLAEPSRAGPGEADDVALVLHTSGTTSRPKMVPLTQGNLIASALAIGRALDLTAADRCLNVMPLFHIHGLIGALLAPLAAGGTVAVTEGFNALKFFGWLDELVPTWYSAVPTMHQTIVARAPRSRDIIARRPLRLIRSSSASLPPPVMAELERTFGAPVIESYGMTEAAHQMASNPLPPRQRKPGTVGIAAGPDIAIMDIDGRMMSQGEKGEVVIRGANVTKGYTNNPDANAKAFTAGWFRTGDEGWLDAEGYLTISGRLKEIINRGGEKIAPREVDEVLLAHEAVVQAVAFAVPHKTLGEDVAAAVVLREGVSATEAELRAFAGERLAPFKVPRRIVILDAIPKGPTGKLQRIGLAARLGLVAEAFVRVAIFGAGAIGGVMGAALTRAGVATTLIARGPHLAAMRRNGLTVRSKGAEVNVRPRLATDGADAGPQDYVVVALKAHAAAATVDAVLPMLEPATAVVTAMNGVPWWYFHGVVGPLADRTLESVDPGSRQWNLLGPSRAIGCVVYPAAEVVEPGVVQVTEGDRFVLGEPDGSSSERVGALARALVKGGLKAPVRPNIRTEIWVKLWGNCVFNPLSALTGATLGGLVADPLTRALARAVMVEVEAVALALGVAMPIDVDARIAGAGRVGLHKTSMLQDLERGRPMEIDALVGAVAELGRLTGVPTPMLDGVHALVRRRAMEAGCYPKETPP